MRQIVGKAVGQLRQRHIPESQRKAPTRHLGTVVERSASESPEVSVIRSTFRVGPTLLVIRAPAVATYPSGREPLSPSRRQQPPSRGGARDLRKASSDLPSAPATPEHDRPPPKNDSVGGVGTRSHQQDCRHLQRLCDGRDRNGASDHAREQQYQASHRHHSGPKPDDETHRQRHHDPRASRCGRQHRRGEDRNRDRKAQQQEPGANATIRIAWENAWHAPSNNGPMGCPAARNGLSSTRSLGEWLRGAIGLA